MQHINKIMLYAALVAITACGGSDVTKKKAKLEKLKKQQAEVTTNIATLEAEIAKLDPASVKAAQTKLVAIAPIATNTFTHYIDLQGKIEAVNISYVTPRNGGGQVKEVFVKKGDAVKKGQLLLQLDNTIAKQSLVAAEQSIQTLKTQLTFAKTIYLKQKSLWDEGIGTEVQLITAKNNVDALESQVKATEEQIKINKEQLAFTNVYSNVDGFAESVNVRVGEIFTGVLGNAAQIVIVNTNNLKITAQIPENYLNKVGVGSKLNVTLPDIHKTITATVSVASKLIDASSRSFYVEAKIPTDKDFHPNQLALINIQDYSNAKAVVVPLNTLQNDEKGKYVMVAVKEGAKLVAKKKVVKAGELYGDKVEILSGLTIGEDVIIEGFQGLYDGQLLTTK
ncbi:MAG: efflux RND transporter periplasmic adaptor subunit [Flavobacterium sp.]|nr:efflux RND transporter periplasmic adaptor subunit [Flavobacterium sp.]